MSNTPQLRRTTQEGFVDALYDAIDDEYPIHIAIDDDGRWYHGHEPSAELHLEPYTRTDTIPEQSALSDEDAQILELVRLAREAGIQELRLFRWNTPILRVQIKYGPMSDVMCESLSSAIEALNIELRSRLQPPQRPTAEEWYRAETSTGTLDAKRLAIRALIKRHEAVDDDEN